METFYGILIPFLGTSLGAACVFFMKKSLSDAVQRSLTGFAAGVMMAASVWSLILPAIEQTEAEGRLPPFLPAAAGIVLGALTLFLLDELVRRRGEGEVHSDFLLLSAITLHNIPEGLAVGVAFGAIGMLPQATVAGAVALALGMGLQNFPEGLAVSMPLRREGLTRTRSFFYGQLSAIVEPVFAFLGALLVYIARPLLPYALAFAAGAMIFVVVEETVPESQASGNGDLATTGFLIGFAVMMVLDVALG